MDNFSQRMGLTSLVPIQKESINESLRNGAWTVIYELLVNDIESSLTGYEPPQWRGKAVGYIRSIWIDFFKLAADSISWNPNDDMAFLRQRFYKFKWNEFYDFIEFFAHLVDDYNRRSLIETFNTLFQRENSAYQFVNERVVEVVSSNEIASIEATKNLPDQTFEHIKKSSQFLFDRVNPDYRNSVKESVSAVESFMRIITNSDKPLGDILRTKNLDMIESHPALMSAIKEFITKIYGYSSDESGVRHSLKENHRDVTRDEAIFILVSVSAVMNYMQSSLKS